MRKLVFSAIVLASIASATVTAQRAGNAPGDHEAEHGHGADDPRLQACQRGCSARFDACTRNADVPRYRECQAALTACASACHD